MTKRAESAALEMLATLRKVRDYLAFPARGDALDICHPGSPVTRRHGESQHPRTIAAAAELAVEVFDVITKAGG